jgi:poly-gamma-glutamate synthesis protein (capsule biosynthesis protein)
VQVLFTGDVMLGRGVAVAADGDFDSVLAGVLPATVPADLVLGNLESPLTVRPHDPTVNAYALEADPAAAGSLARAGFSAMSIANNHAGDAGPLTVPDTTAALSAAGVDVVGAGDDVGEAFSPRVVEVGSVTASLLAFDLTGVGPRAGAASPGVAWWSRRLVRESVVGATERTDLVFVGLHGGTEYRRRTDRSVTRAARCLVRWGADVVWGHGPHVVQPVRLVSAAGNRAVVAPSLGNLVFDQHLPGTRRGALLSVLADADGIVAYRVGRTDEPSGPVAFRGWKLPEGNAVAVDGSWWTPARPVRAPDRPAVSLNELQKRFDGTVVDATIGDPDADGRSDLVVAFRRPYQPTLANRLYRQDRLVDAAGRTAHLGVYRARDLRPRWVAGTVLRPIRLVAACDGGIAVAHSTLRSPQIVATSAWVWSGFGFYSLASLPGGGRPTCADLDRDGRLDPLVLGRGVS